MGTPVGLLDTHQGITVLPIVSVVLLHPVAVLLGGGLLAGSPLLRGINHPPLVGMGRHQEGHLHHAPARGRNLVQAHLVPDLPQLLPLVILHHPLQESAVVVLVLLAQELKVRRSVNDLEVPPHVLPAQVLTSVREWTDKHNTEEHKSIGLSVTCLLDSSPLGMN